MNLLRLVCTIETICHHFKAFIALALSRDRYISASCPKFEAKCDTTLVFSFIKVLVTTLLRVFLWHAHSCDIRKDV